MSKELYEKYVKEIIYDSDKDKFVFSNNIKSKKLKDNFEFENEQIARRVLRSWIYRSKVKFKDIQSEPALDLFTTLVSKANKIYNNANERIGNSKQNK